MSQKMSVVAHLEELRRRLIYSLLFIGGGFLIAFAKRQFFLKIVTEPHEWAMEKLNLPTTLFVFRYQDNFMAQLKLCFIVGAFIACPFILYQILKFVSAGLYEHEKKSFLLYFPFFILLFCMGCIFGYFFLIPYGLEFLASFGQDAGLVSMMSFSDYMTFFFLLTLTIGFIFELPLAMLIPVCFGLFEASEYKKKRKHAILGAFIVGGILTPPDPVTQLLLTGPLILLYEVGYFLSRFVEKKRMSSVIQSASPVILSASPVILSESRGSPIGDSSDSLRSPSE